jgi:adenylate kinase family enzyme
MRIAILGVPRSGKTTLALSLGLPVRHTDDLIPLGWSQASEAASRWFDEPGDLLVEGVAAVRALRKFLQREPTKRPVDAVVWLDRPRMPLTGGQAAMAKGCRTVFEEIWDELLRRGVRLLTPTDLTPGICAAPTES